MKWRQARRSTNVEDRRGMRPRTIAGAGLGGGAVLLIAVIAMLLGEDPARVAATLEQAGGATVERAPGPQGRSPDGAGDEQVDFVGAVLGDTEDTWNQIFAAHGRRYQPPKLIVFSDSVRSACGFSSAAVGPFYCPGDRQVYIDLAFFRDLHRRFGAPGDFAQAYVIAHEVGHHVQNLLGISDEVRRLQSRSSRSEANALSVRLELQADCFAGVWGYHAASQRQLLEAGDVEEGLNAAAAIGDDRLQRRSSGQVHPESWTHGSSEQRVRWFRRGLENGRLEVCDTFQESRR